MPTLGFQDGWFRSLMAADRVALVAHWRRLPEDCLRRRFLRRMDGAALERHARTALSEGAEVIGWFRGGVLRGVAEVHIAGRRAEAAFSVEPEWRERGIGRALMGLALRRARNRGCRDAVVMTTRDNRPMISIARAAGAVLDHDGGEVTGRIALEPATLATRLLDLSEEENALVAEWPGQMVRMADVWFSRG